MFIEVHHLGVELFRVALAFRPTKDQKMVGIVKYLLVI